MFLKPNVHKKPIPYQSTPQVCYLEKFLQPQSAVRSKTGFFSGLKEAIVEVKKTVVASAKKVAETVKFSMQAALETAKTTEENTILKNTVTTEEALTSIVNIEKLKETRKNYEDLCVRYVGLFGQEPEVMTISHSKIATLTELKKCIATITPIIEREEMMVSLEHEFKKGASAYLPHKFIKPFNIKELKEICLSEGGKPYKKELAGMAQIFIENSCRVDDSMENFNQLSKNYFSEAVKSVKEIYNIKSDGSNKLLERIPKLGIIPKILRVNEQTRLTRCVISDFCDISQQYVEKGLKPYLQKYNNQYEQIQKFVEKHKMSTFLNYRYTNRVMQKVDEIRKHRLETQIKLLNSFAANGANLSKMCKSIERSGEVEIAKKALFMLIPYL